MSSKGACVLWILTEMSFPSILPSQLPFADAAHHKDDHFAMVPTSRAAFKGLTGRRPQSSDWFAASGNDSAAWSAPGGSGMLLNVLATSGRFSLNYLWRMVFTLDLTPENGRTCVWANHGVPLNRAISASVFCFGCLLQPVRFVCFIGEMRRVLW
jgi:hypothetical protein